MVVIEIKDSIAQEELIQAKVEDIEDVVNNKIRDALSAKIVEALDEMAFVDMEQNEETGRFDITASLVLCATQDIGSALEIVAQKLSNLDLDQEDIEDVLKSFTETNGGF